MLACFGTFKPWSNGLASRRKFAKPELAYGLAKGGQTDSQVGSQIAESHKFHAYHWLIRFYNNSLLAINLCRLALGGQTVKKTCVYLRPNLSSTKVNASPRKSSQVDASLVGAMSLDFTDSIKCRCPSPRKSSQVDASRRKWMAKRNAS